MRRLLLAMLVRACGHGAAPPGYPVPHDLAAVVVDEAAFARFAAPLRIVLEREAAAATASTPSPPAERAARKQTWFDLALLDSLDGRWIDAGARLDAILAEELDPAGRWMLGLTIRAWADAIAARDDNAAGFAAALEQHIRTMPYPVVAASLDVLYGLGAQLTIELSRSLITSELAPSVHDDRADREVASALLFQRYAVLRIIPVGAAIVTVLDRVRRDQPPAPTASAADRTPAP